MKIDFVYMENLAYDWMAQNACRLARLGLAIVYGWFGALKFVDMSPAAPLIQGLAPWLPIPHFSHILGVWEVTVALCMLLPKFQRLGLLLIAMHMPGTLLPFLLTPDKVFSQFPFGLTLEGQYIVKNLLLVAGAMMLGGSFSKKERGQWYQPLTKTPAMTVV